MIKILKEPEEVALIISVDDNVEEAYGCTRGEFVQLLVSVCKDPRVLIIGIFNEEDKIIGYTFVQSYISPPLSRVVHIIYAYSPTNTIDNEQGMELILDWARKQGANKVTASTKKPEVLIGKYGFKESEYHILEIDL